MHSYALEHVASNVLLRGLHALAATARSTNALLLAHIGEVKERKLYRGAAQPNMHLYCVNVLRFSEDAAHKWLQAAGAARRFPAIFGHFAVGRLHLSGICLLAPHLLPENADELITASLDGTKAGIEKVLAEKFPRPDVPEMLGAVAATPVALPPPQVGSEPKTAPGQFFFSSSQALTDPETLESPNNSGVQQTVSPSEQPVAAPQYPIVKPLAPKRYGLQATIDEETHDLIREAQDLLAHTEGGRQVANVLRRALEFYVPHLRRRRFAQTERPRRSAKKPKSVRTIPATVKRAVKARDEGRCTFANETGERCPAKSGLEYDHVKPVAKGGETTVENLRLRCRAHNQLAAEQAYGEEFMRRKREESRHETAIRRPSSAPRAAVDRGADPARPPRHPEGTAASDPSALREKAYEVIPWLRNHPGPAPNAP